MRCKLVTIARLLTPSTPFFLPTVTTFRSMQPCVRRLFLSDIYPLHVFPPNSMFISHAVKHSSNSYSLDNLEVQISELKSQPQS